MADVARQVGCENVVVAESVEGACEYAMEIAQPDDAVLVAGSLYIVSEARPFLVSKVIK